MARSSMESYTIASNNPSPSSSLLPAVKVYEVEEAVLAIRTPANLPSSVSTPLTLVSDMNMHLNSL